MTESEPKPRTKGDPILEILQALANRFQMSIGITLQLPGGLVTGTLVGVRQFYKEQGDLLGDGFDQIGDRGGDVMRDVMSGAAADFDAKYEADSTDEDFDLELWRTEWVHLSGARYVVDQNMLDMPGVLLRARIADVVTYSLGSLGPG